MFEVCLDYHLGADWPETDKNLFAVAGRVSDHSGTYLPAGRREHIWDVPSFQEAADLVRALRPAIGWPSTTAQVHFREKATPDLTRRTRAVLPAGTTVYLEGFALTL